MAESSIIKAPSALDSRMAIIETRRDKLAAFLTPLGLSTDRFLTQMRFAMLKQPKLQTCDPESLLECAVQASELGLAPDGTLGSAWMVPFNDKKRGQIAVLIPGYQGLIDLAVRSGTVLGIDATIVHARDVWEYEPKRGERAEFIHIPYSPKIARWEPKGDDVIAFDAGGQEMILDPGQMVRAYAVATLRGGVKQPFVMELRDLINRRNRAASWRNSSSAWHSTEIQVVEAMFRKIPVRAICKLLPLSPGEHTRLLEKGLALEDRDYEPEEAPPESPPPRKSKARVAVEGPPPAGGTVDAPPPQGGPPPAEPEPGSDG